MFKMYANLKEKWNKCEKTILDEKHNLNENVKCYIGN